MLLTMVPKKIMMDVHVLFLYAYVYNTNLKNTHETRLYTNNCIALKHGHPLNIALPVVCENLEKEDK